MAKLISEIDTDLAAWLAAQPLFFVASAPLAADGHINLSPRGLDSFRVLGPRQVAVLDLHGSGNETAAHLAENGRVTLMFCAFSGPARIIRLYGSGEVLGPGHRDFPAIRAHFPAELAFPRQIFRVALDRIQSSCGYGVPIMEYRSQRDELIGWSLRKGEAGLAAYRRDKNAVSIDGLPAPEI